jgi:ligand-binding sensor domain-containing protein
MRFTPGMRTTATFVLFLIGLLSSHPVHAQEGATPRSLYFSFYFAPPPSGLSKAAPVYQGFARSTDRGTTWRSLGWLTSFVSGFAIDPRNPGRIVLASDYGVLLSENGGEKWKLTSDWSMPPVLAVRLRGTEIWAATARGIFVSSDDGRQWTARSAGLPVPNGNYVSDILFTSDALLAATADGVFRSADEGKSWTRSGLNGEEVFRFVSHPTHSETIAAISQAAGLWVSTDGGRLWDSRGTALPSKRIKCAAFDPRDPRTLLAGTADMGVLRSPDLGQKWELSSGGLTNFNITSLLFDPDIPDRVYAGAENGAFVSDNRGKTWQAFTVRLGYVSGMEMR